jgi:hypothetical protein
MARLKLCEFEAKSGGSSSGNANGLKRGARGKGRGRSSGDGTASSSCNGNKLESGSGLGPTKKDQCKRCDKFGHWARDCRSKPKAEAHVAQAEEEIEPALLMARATVIDTAPRVGDFKIQAPRRLLHVVEEKVFVQLDEETPLYESLWYLDSGATNHMSGYRGAFIDIDTTICGSVKFGDGSEVAIEGSGTVLFEGKTDEHIPLTGGVLYPEAHHQHCKPQASGRGWLRRARTTWRLEDPQRQRAVDCSGASLGKPPLLSLGQDWAPSLPQRSCKQ